LDKRLLASHRLDIICRTVYIMSGMSPPAAGVSRTRSLITPEPDGIFIGGGHNSLVAATYLARAGLRVLVLEATDRLGGGMLTTEATLPLFRHNLHAHFVRWQPDNPVWQDLRIDRFGLEAILPEVQDAIVFDEGRSVLMHYHDPARSREAIAGISQHDASAFERLYNECLSLSRAIIAPLRFVPPLPPEEEDALLSRSTMGRRYRELRERSSTELISEWFESDPVRVLFGFNIAVRGFQPVMGVTGTGYAAVVSLPASSQAQLVKGGSGEVARALGAALFAAGGVAITGAEVASIDVRDGRAHGVTLVDGRHIPAKRFVASSVPAPITLLDLVGHEHLDASLANDLRGYHWNHDYALFGFHLALRARPRFTLEDRVADLPFAHDIALGYEQLTDLSEEIDEVRAGAVGRFRVQTTIPTIHDPSQAPDGHHVAFGWKVVPPGMSDDGSLTDRMVAGYSEYAPNVREDLLAAAGYSPADIGATLKSMPNGDHLHGSFHPDNFGYNRPHPSLSGFRTPIEGLFLCGSSQHPGGGFSGACGYIAAGVIAEDLKIDAWWERKTVEQILRALSDSRS
jgi:phytoene dehydrogenase-like protein